MKPSPPAIEQALSAATIAALAIDALKSRGPSGLKDMMVFPFDSDGVSRLLRNKLLMTEISVSVYRK
jgi:hypothetical protein